MTPFTEIYDVFLSQISDYEFMSIDENDELKHRYLLNSIPKFRKCKVDLSDRNIDQFNQKLTDAEILILGTLMVLEYLNPRIISLENVKMFMNSKDFHVHSQANHLERLIELRESKRREVEMMMVHYTYDNGKLENLR